MEIEELKKISANTLNPDDILVVKIDVPVTVGIRKDLEHIFLEKFGLKNKIMVLDKGIDIEILKKGEMDGHSGDQEKNV